MHKSCVRYDDFLDRLSNDELLNHIYLLCVVLLSRRIPRLITENERIYS